MCSAALHKIVNMKIIPISSLQTNSKHSILRGFTNSRIINQTFGVYYFRKKRYLKTRF